MPCPSHPPQLDYSNYNWNNRVEEDEMGGTCRKAKNLREF
jgi:hypothetical protein